MRINKFIADSGVCSRRNADKLVAEGKVKVNNKLVTEMGLEINEDNDTVTVEGKKIERVARYVYLMLNKPKGCLSTLKDEKNERKTIMDYVDITDKRIYPIGRLDYDTEGLLLLTNDGGLSYKLTHPSQDIAKTYLTKIQGQIQESDLATLRNGIVLDGIKTHKSKIKVKSFENDITTMEVTIFEGRNRQVRRMFEHVEKEVIFLKRVAIGDLRLGGLSRGTWRYLTEREISYLLAL